MAIRFPSVSPFAGLSAQNSDCKWMLQLFFPYLHILEPCFGCGVSEGFLARCEHGVVAEVLLTGSGQRVEEVVFVLHFLADVFLWNAGGKSYGLLGIFHGVCHRPVSSPASHQPVMVGEGDGFSTHDVLHACAEHFIIQRFVKSGFDKQVAMSGI